MAYAYKRRYSNKKGVTYTEIAVARKWQKRFTPDQLDMIDKIACDLSVECRSKLVSEIEGFASDFFDLSWNVVDRSPAQEKERAKRIAKHALILTDLIYLGESNTMPRLNLNTFIEDHFLRMEGLDSSFWVLRRNPQLWILRMLSSLRSAVADFEKQQGKLSGIKQSDPIREFFVIDVQRVIQNAGIELSWKVRSTHCKLLELAMELLGLDGIQNVRPYIAKERVKRIFG